MIDDIPDYSYKQLAEALGAYGFSLDDNHYSLQEYVEVTPDKFFYFFTDRAHPDEVLTLLVEDYITGLDYVKDCFNKELDSRLVKLHEVVHSKDSAEFEERIPVKAATTYPPPDNWNELRSYAIDYPPFYFGFLATIAPHNPKQFWVELHERLEQF